MTGLPRARLLAPWWVRLGAWWRGHESRPPCWTNDGDCPFCDGPLATDRCEMYEWLIELRGQDPTRSSVPNQTNSPSGPTRE